MLALNSMFDGLPLVAVGGCIQTVSKIVLDGDFESSTPVEPGNPSSGATYQPLSFGAIHDALARGQYSPQPTLITDVNAEANIITTLIYHADGRRPASVCGRSVIRDILKHVR
jgi:hypothetical protein